MRAHFFLSIAFAVSAAVAPAVAHAEPRRTLEPVALRKKPGEHEAVVAQLPAGTRVAVLSIEGRWLLVRVNNTSGYLARTTVSAPEGAAAPTGQWSAARKVDGKLVADLSVQVAASRATLRAQPRSGAARVAEAARGQQLVVVDAASDPAWIHVRDPAGRDGWVARAEVDNGASSVAVTGGDFAGAGPVRDEARARARAQLAVRAELGVGFRALGMELRSNGEGGLTNYVLDAGAAAMTLEIDVARRLGGRLFVAADSRFSVSDSSPGIQYSGPTAPAGRIPFHTVASDAGVRIGVRAHGAFDLALRAGGHVDAFVARRVDNPARLPRERLVGATLGARADIAPERSRFTATARFDAMVIGARAQTSGLEDGPGSTTRALWGGMTMRYAVFERLAVLGGYDVARATTEWSGMSVRQPGVTRTRRVDTAQLVQIGLSTEF